LYEDLWSGKEYFIRDGLKITLSTSMRKNAKSCNAHTENRGRDTSGFNQTEGKKFAAHTKLHLKRVSKATKR